VIQKPLANYDYVRILVALCDEKAIHWETAAISEVTSVTLSKRLNASVQRHQETVQGSQEQQPLPPVPALLQEQQDKVTLVETLPFRSQSSTPLESDFGILEDLFSLSDETHADSYKVARSYETLRQGLVTCASSGVRTFKNPTKNQVFGTAKVPF
ncbi:unnamed protein product, partial [Didymodactylos carnosus]